jgi:hypothetical protein
MIHLTRKRGDYSLDCKVSENQTITPVAEATGGNQTALRWLGVWFDRKLSFRRHVDTRIATAQRVARHLRSLANTSHGFPAAALRKAVTTCVLPSLLYGTEAWYEGRTKDPGTVQNAGDRVSTCVGWHVAAIDRTLILAARAVLPAWKTTPSAVLLREAGLPSATVALEEAKLRFATHLQTTDISHPLTHRTQPQRMGRGRRAAEQQMLKSKVQRLGRTLLAVLRPTITAPHYSKDCRADPTEGQA